jgi:Fe-S oxidoreductase
LATGQWEAARELVQHNLEAIQNTGAKTVVTACAECYKTLKVDYPRISGKSTDDMGYKTLHITEYVASLIGDGKYRFTKDVPMKVTFHDPCNLGRLSDPWVHWEGKHLKFGVLDPPKVFRRGDQGVYDPPREILNSIPGLELTEMERVKDNTWCCGAGAGVGIAFPEFARWTVEERIEEAECTGAEAVITCCPACKDLFERTIKTNNQTLEVYDMSEIMLKAIS